MNKEHLRANVCTYPEQVRPTKTESWPGAVTQARFNRDMTWLAWCMGNFGERWAGDDGRILRPTREKPTPGHPHCCYDAAFVALTWPADAKTAGDAYWAALDAEYEAILTEAGSWATDQIALLAGYANSEVAVAYPESLVAAIAKRAAEKMAK